MTILAQDPVFTPGADDPVAAGGFEVAILLGRGMPLREQKRSLAEIGLELVARGLVGRVEIAFAEMSAPSLEAVLSALRAEGVGSCVVIPVIVPFDRNLRGWLGRWLSRWTTDGAGSMRVVLADPVDGVADLLAPVASAFERALPRDDVRDAIKPLKIKAGASRIPDVARVALVCLGPRCAQAGGFDIYDRLRRRFGPHKPDGLNDQPLLCLRTNCQGPCNFAPLVAVQPDNIWYGQLSPEGIDRIADEHFGRGGPPLVQWALKPGARLRDADGSLAEPDLPFVSATVGDIRIERLFVRKAMAEENALAAFMDIENIGANDDELVSIDCALTERVAVHDARAHRTAGHGHHELLAGQGLPLSLAPSSTVRLAPGRLHMMMLDIADLPEPGGQLDLGFNFRRMGRVDVRCFVHATE
jgi:(2Fe-2S) ferredoxin/copper(I)-binding protein